jgi:uncharacterized iron-regulated membrane protein
LRRAIYKVHLWTGLLLGLYMLIMSVTGASLVFREEMHRASRRALLRTAAPVAPADVLPPGAIHGRAAALAPGGRFNSIAFPDGPDGTYRVAMNVRSEVAWHYFHPATGEHLGSVRQRSGILSWLQQLHFNLLSGSTGRTVNGVGGLLLFLLCLTGVPIWWQGLQRWRRGLTVTRNSSWKRMNWDLHGAVGIYTFVLAAVWGLTGAYFAFPDAARRVVGTVLPVSPRAPEMRAAKGPQEAKPDTCGPQPLDRLAASALRAAPGSRVTMIAFPAAAGQPARVMVMPADAGPSDRHRRGDVFVDRCTAGVVRMSLYEGAPAGDRLIRWVAPVHFGTFGGTGVKLLWVFFGLAPGLLAVTGTLIWWNRSGSRMLGAWRRRREDAAPPQGAPGAAPPGLAPVSSTAREEVPIP